MTTRYAKVLGGAILEERDTPPVGNQSALAPGKPKWLPIEVTEPEYDPVSQVREGPEVTVLSTKVTEVYTVRAKNADEIAAMIADKDAAYEAEFGRRCDAAIVFPVNGTSYTWHADAEGRENIMGIVVMIAAGVAVPDPRPFTPDDNDGQPVNLSHADFIGLGAAIAGRKDALFVKKKAMQASLAAMTDPVEIDALDVTQGW